MIDLEKTEFDFSAVVAEMPTVDTMHKGKWRRLPDFGTVFIGLDKIKNEEDRELLVRCWADGDGPIFKAPDNWGWPQIARALGAFKSASQARKNGWGQELENGINVRVARINKVQGELSVMFIGDDHPFVGD